MVNIYIYIYIKERILKKLWEELTIKGKIGEGRKQEMNLAKGCRKLPPTPEHPQKCTATGHLLVPSGSTYHKTRFILESQIF